MRPRPKKPGETVAEYNAFIASMPKMGGRPKTGGGAPSTPRGTSPSKPVRVMPGKTPMRVTGGMGSSSGGSRPKPLKGKM
jgi:hypothetical protein